MVRGGGVGGGCSMAPVELQARRGVVQASKPRRRPQPAHLLHDAENGQAQLARAALRDPRARRVVNSLRCSRRGGARAGEPEGGAGACSAAAGGGRPAQAAHTQAASSSSSKGSPSRCAPRARPRCHRPRARWSSASASAPAGGWAGAAQHRQLARAARRCHVSKHGMAWLCCREAAAGGGSPGGA